MIHVKLLHISYMCNLPYPILLKLYCTLRTIYTPPPTPSRKTQWCNSLVGSSSSYRQAPCFSCSSSSLGMLRFQSFTTPSPPRPPLLLSHRSHLSFLPAGRRAALQFTRLFFIFTTISGRRLASSSGHLLQLASCSRLGHLAALCSG